MVIGCWTHEMLAYAYAKQHCYSPKHIPLARSASPLTRTDRMKFSLFEGFVMFPRGKVLRRSIYAFK